MWLINPDMAGRMEAAEKWCADLSVAQRAEYIEAANGRDGGVLSVIGDRAQIRVEGILTNSPDPIARFFGIKNTTYSEIREALATANADESVSTIVMAIDSPGGSVDGLFPLVKALQESDKPTQAVVYGQASSAAYAIAAQSESIEASNDVSFVGSIGVVVSVRVEEDIVSITSSDAPNKAPNVQTEAGVATVRALLDEVHTVFAEAISSGRGVSVETVNSEFGRGAVFTAREAIKRGMIDSISGSTVEPFTNETPDADNGEPTEAKVIMDLQTLRAEHPALFAEAVEIGVNQERDRVSAHMTLGQACGAMDIATKAIEAGDGLTESLRAKYFAEGLKMRDVQTRAADDSALDGLDGDNTDPKASSEAKDKAVGNGILAAAAEHLHVKMEA